jgi:hypothetical protein
MIIYLDSALSIYIPFSITLLGFLELVIVKRTYYLNEDLDMVLKLRTVKDGYQSNLFT